MSIHRIEVRPKTGDVDPRGDAAMQSARIAAAAGSADGRIDRSGVPP